jgi:hypothetical protein
VNHNKRAAKPITDRRIASSPPPDRIIMMPAAASRPVIIRDLRVIDLDLNMHHSL